MVGSREDIVKPSGLNPSEYKKITVVLGAEGATTRAMAQCLDRGWPLSLATCEPTHKPASEKEADKMSGNPKHLPVNQFTDTETMDDLADNIELFFAGYYKQYLTPSVVALLAKYFEVENNQGSVENRLTDEFFSQQIRLLGHAHSPNIVYWHGYTPNDDDIVDLSALPSNDDAPPQPRTNHYLGQKTVRRYGRYKTQ